MVYKSDILYYKTKTGAMNQWRIYTVGPIIYTEYGQVNGKLQVTCGAACIATNVGKSNERNATEQAEVEAEAMVREKLRLKYSTSFLEASEVRIQPMLANDGHKVKFSFPIDAQYKYDGLRALWDGDNLISRGNKIYNIPHITNILKELMPSTMLDGEIYIHGISLQQLNSWTKKNQLDSLKLEYHIYDMPGKGTWEERKILLNQNAFKGPIKLAKTYIINSMDELVALHNQAVEEGFEGLIIRLPNGLYEFGKRSLSLLKWKASEDSEFKIIGMRTGVGKMSQCPVFRCKNDINELEFDVVPIGTMEDRKEMLTDENLGKLLTVKYFGRSEDGIPKFATGKTIREDL